MFKKTKEKISGRDIRRIAECTLLVFFQNNGFSREEKIKALNDIIKISKIETEFKQGNQMCGWYFDKSGEGEKGIKFREELEKCFPLGKFEDEVDAIENLIYKARNNNGNVS